MGTSSCLPITLLGPSASLDPTTSYFIVSILQTFYGHLHGYSGNNDRCATSGGRGVFLVLKQNSAWNYLVNSHKSMFRKKKISTFLANLGHQRSKIQKCDHWAQIILDC